MCGGKKVCVMGHADLRVVGGAGAVAASPLDADEFQAACVDAFVASWTARGFSAVTIENASGVLDRFLGRLGMPAWEAEPDDIDRVVGDLAADGIAASTRRGYVQAFKEFHRFLSARNAAEIEPTFGVVLEDPVEAYNAVRDVGNEEYPSARQAPAVELMVVVCES